MTIADRIQSLRKGRGISQEELADRIGVSRQAVSKWESEQSTPDLEKVLLLSDYFEVTTDYLLRGIEPPKPSAAEQTGGATSRILYIGSTAMIAIGLLCAFGGWYAEQSAESIWGSMILQVVGVAGYAIGRLLSQTQAPLLVRWLNVCLVMFMPLSLLLALLYGRAPAPYPTDLSSGAVFAAAYGLLAVLAFVLIKRSSK